MNIKQLSEMREKGGTGNATPEELSEMLETFFSCVAQSRGVILGKISERTFVDFCRTAKLAIISACLSKGEGRAILLAEVAGELDGLLDTYFLAVLGMLMQEEVV